MISRLNSQGTHASGAPGVHRSSRGDRCRGEQRPRGLRNREGARQRRSAVGDPDDLRQGREAAGERRQPSAARRARRGQDVFRRHPRRDQQREVRAPPGARRPAADRNRRIPDDQPRDRGVDDRIRPARVRRSDPARRDQPYSAQVAERLPRGSTGPHGDGGQDHLRAAALQFRHCDDEPGRARPGHVSAVGSRH